MNPEEREFYFEMAAGIRQRREKLNLTPKSLAKISGLTLEHLTDMESGEWSICCFSFFKVMDALDKVEGEKTIEV